MRASHLVTVILLTACSSSSSSSSPSTPPSNGEAGAAGSDDGGAPPLVGCEALRAELEHAMAVKLDAAATDPEITAEPNFTLLLETASGHRFVHSHGDSTLDTVYESASTSKWVAATVILDLVDRGVLALDDSPSKYLPFWKSEGVTLAQLLSFTSGYAKEPLCINLPKADFTDCVEKAYAANPAPAAPGSTFDYSSTHLQIAGLMAVRAANAAGFRELFEAWQARTGLFPSAAFDLPSPTNPRLAGGMHWTGAEYAGFLRAIYDGKVLEAATRQAMLGNQRGPALVVGSPALDALDRDWAYGFGNWLECASEGANSFDCGAGHRNSSPGAYGAYPFIDFDHHYLGILARQGTLGTFRDGDALFQVIGSDASAWADACAEE